ncbi:adenosylmethionine decarboxylase [Butyrivibrio sp. AC2005]|uniref:adenosylmethionine decarboxylase n=1 Tax=Butyrivibrio sp. AC2005 TaxID=1280672 RepID=UPI00040A3714|nr:adenosylmethionine decarboxylase [Butyrivibrio sp. AC2005]
MAKQLVADLYGCGAIIDDPGKIQEAAHTAINYVGAEIVEECIHEFEPIGVTYFAVITTSHFSVHTWPEFGYAAIDIFSCSDTVVDGIAEKLKELFGAEQIKTKVIERDISAGDKSAS